MPYRKDATLQDAEMFQRFHMLWIDFEELKRSLASGAHLEQECSTCSDPGDDYVALLLDGQRIGYWPGY